MGVWLEGVFHIRHSRRTNGLIVDEYFRPPRVRTSSERRELVSREPYDALPRPVSAQLSEQPSVRIRYTYEMENGRRRTIAGGRSATRRAMASATTPSLRWVAEVC